MSSTNGPKMNESLSYTELFVQPPTFEMVDVLAAKLPRGENSVTVGYLVRYEARSEKEAIGSASSFSSCILYCEQYTLGVIPPDDMEKIL